MPWSFPVAAGDVLETTLSFVALDQLIQYKFDALIGGTPGSSTSDDVLDQMVSNFGGISSLLGTSTKHAQTRIQRISDCVLSTGGTPRRVRGQLDKRGPTTTLDGVSAGPFAPMICCISAQLITLGAPKQFWGKKGFGQVPVSVLQADGQKITSVARANWLSAVEAFFCITTPFGSLGGTYNCGVLPTTYVANQALPHGAMSGYFWAFVAAEIGYYAGTQKTRDIEPQATLGH